MAVCDNGLKLIEYLKENDNVAKSTKIHFQDSALNLSTKKLGAFDLRYKQKQILNLSFKITKNVNFLRYASAA